MTRTNRRSKLFARRNVCPRAAGSTRRRDLRRNFDITERARFAAASRARSWPRTANRLRPLLDVPEACPGVLNSLLSTPDRCSPWRRRSLVYLLFVNADIVIPDALLHEATRDANRLGAQGIIDWVKAHRTHIEIAATKAYEIFDAARATIPNLREPDLGERAAFEVIEEPDRLQGDERGLLLCEETAVLRRI